MRIAAASALAAALLAGCGGSAPVARLAGGDAARLRDDIGAIRTAAASGDPAAARAATARLRSEIQALQTEGRLSAADAQVMLVAVGHLGARISAAVQARVHRGPVPSAPVAPAKPHGHGHGHDHGGGDGGD